MTVAKSTVGRGSQGSANSFPGRIANGLTDGGGQGVAHPTGQHFQVVREAAQVVGPKTAGTAC
jgi:hypothetical protein